MLLDTLMQGGEIPLWASLLAALVVAPGFALAAFWATSAVLDRVMQARHARVLQRVIGDGRAAVRVAVMLLAVRLALPEVDLPRQAVEVVSRIATQGMLLAIGWALTRKVAAVFDVYMERDLGLDADWLERRRRTQLIFFRRLATSTCVVVTAGLVLTAIPAVRAVGLSLFASAGVAGIVLGLAARPAVFNLIAGIQLALTQPFRLGDAVVVEGDWGHVTEITATYVTITTWDQRSLVVPLGYFLDRPIRNLTKKSSELMDTILVHVDFTMPVAAVRAEAHRILENTPLWDRRVFAVQVTDLKERSMELRVLMSATNADRMFDLRCIMREKLMAFVVCQHPMALPQCRLVDRT